MEEIINNIRKFSLRNWLLIALGLSVLQYLLMLGGISGGILEMIMIIGRVPDLIVISSLVCFAVNQEKKIQIALILTILGVLIGIIGVFTTFSGFTGMLLRDATAKHIHIGELQEYIFNQMFTFNILQYLFYLAALAIGITSINQKLKTPYIVLYVGYITYLIVLWICNVNYDNIGFQFIPALILLIGMIWLIIIGGKNNIQYFLGDNDQIVQFKTTQPSNPSSTSTSPSFKDKSQQLFKLKELLDAGIITEKEFNIEKAKILKH